MTNNPKNSDQLLENLRGAFDVMLGRPDGLKRMDTSSDGVWWSFAGLALTGLIDASALSARYATHHVSTLASSPSKLFFILGSLGIATVAYAISMFLLYLMCRRPEEQQRFSFAIVAHNWAAPLVSLAVLPLLLLSTTGQAEGTSAGGVWTLVTILLLGIFVTIGIRIIRISLEVSLSKSLVFFSVTTFASLIVIEWLEVLVGFR